MSMNKRLLVGVTVFVAAASWAWCGSILAAPEGPARPQGRPHITVETDSDGGWNLSLEDVTPLEFAALVVIAVTIIAGLLIARKKWAERGS